MPGKHEISVKAPHNAHIVLSSVNEDSTPQLEIFIGGWDNQKSAMRLNKEKPDVAEAETPDILTGDDFKNFTLEWDDEGKIELLQDGAPMLSWTNPEPFPINFYGVRTAWGSTGEFKIDSGDSFETSDSFDYTYFAVEKDAPASEDAPAETNEVPVAAAEVPSMEGITWIKSTNGEVPEGAFVGGNDTSGDILYVVRCVMEGAVIPGKLNPTHGVAYFPWGGSENPADEYEVLVVEPEAVNWVASSGGEAIEGAIPGGMTLDGETLFIARAAHEESLTPGKAHLSHGCSYISYGGAEIGVPEYEILVKV